MKVCPRTLKACHKVLQGTFKGIPPRLPKVPAQPTFKVPTGTLQGRHPIDATANTQHAPLSTTLLQDVQGYLPGTLQGSPRYLVAPLGRSGKATLRWTFKVRAVASRSQPRRSSKATFQRAAGYLPEPLGVPAGLPGGSLPQPPRFARPPTWR